jgi:segregation and condensation protein B
MSRNRKDVKLTIQEAAQAARELDLMSLARTEGLNLEFTEDSIDEGESEAASDRDFDRESEANETIAEVLAGEDLSAVEGDMGAPDASDMERASEVGLEGLDFALDEDSELAASLAEDEGAQQAEQDLAGTELEGFEAAEIEDLEILTSEQVRSIVESILFSTDKPLSIAVMKQSFKGSQVKSKDIREALLAMTEEYAQTQRGFTLQEVGGGFQLRTKPENMKYLRQGVKARPFKLSGPALETLSIVAYKQPTTKAQIDEIRGVESGHLLRALMEKHLLTFGERSDLPGKPMYYETTKKFLEIFGLRNLQELPSLSEIDQLIPEGIGEVEEKETLGDLTEQLSQTVGTTYSEAEDELLKITDELTAITTSSEFFEQEKVRMRERRDLERAQNIREALTVGETVDEKDVKWLERYDAAQAQAAEQSAEVALVVEGTESESSEIESSDRASSDSDTGSEAKIDTNVDANIEADSLDQALSNLLDSGKDL